MADMTKAVIGMPYEMAMESEISRRQFWDRAQGLLAAHAAEQRRAAVLEQNCAEMAEALERVRAEGERLIEKWRAHAKRLRRDKQPNAADMADDCADELHAAMGSTSCSPKGHDDSKSETQGGRSDG